MSPIIKVLILAVIQGVAEFLPVSSSGHLVIAKHYLELKSTGVLLEVALHTGTLLAILAYYRKRILELISGFFSGDRASRFYCIAVVVATIPAICGYALFDDQIESLFNSARAAALMLCFTGVVLMSLLAVRKKMEALNIPRSIAIGLAQALAMIPGISRSGSTIAAGRHLGLSPERAAEFSFLMAVPVLAGAALLEVIKLDEGLTADITVGMLAAGIVVSAVVGLGCLMLLVKVLKSGRFWVFGVYCLAVGLGVLLFG